MPAAVSVTVIVTACPYAGLAGLMLAVTTGGAAATVTGRLACPADAFAVAGVLTATVSLPVWSTPPGIVTLHVPSAVVVQV